MPDNAGTVIVDSPATGAAIARGRGGDARVKYAPNVRLIRLMCSGGGPAVRAQGAGRGGRWRARHRLPPRRLPLSGAELQTMRRFELLKKTLRRWASRMGASS